jgi:hypothetical protein
METIAKRIALTRFAPRVFAPLLFGVKMFSVSVKGKTTSRKGAKKTKSQDFTTENTESTETEHKR